MIEGFIRRKKFVYMCTNAQVLLGKIDLYKPSKYLSLGIHLDGTREMHDKSVNKPGAYDIAVKGIKEADKARFGSPPTPQFSTTPILTKSVNSSTKQWRLASRE